MDLILLWGDFFLIEGIFPLELIWVLTPFPLKKTLTDESIDRGLVCAHMHSIAWIQKILTFMSQTGECQQQESTQHAPSTKTEYDCLSGWIKKWSPAQKSHRNGEHQIYSWGTQKKKKRKSSASGGFAPWPLPGCCLWTPPGAFCGPRPSTFRLFDFPPFRSLNIEKREPYLHDFIKTF